MDRELLIEIGVEELPASWLPGLTRQLAESVDGAASKELRIAPGAPVESFSTPRRLTVRVARIAERQEDLDETITGPPVSAAFERRRPADAAALGFAKKQGVPFEQLTRREDAEGGVPRVSRSTHARQERRRRAAGAADRRAARLWRSRSRCTGTRRSRTARASLLFGRPIRWLLFLYGGRVVPFTIGRAANAAGPQVQDVESGALTYGHRFLATSGRAGRSIKVRSFDEYRARLAEHFVVLEHAERRDRIARELERTRGGSAAACS